jgi:hypothetical protein
MEDNRKKWITPLLIVLGRGTPEENVLAGCKTKVMSGISATKVSCKKTSASACSGNRCNVVSTTS